MVKQESESPIPLSDPSFVDIRDLSASSLHKIAIILYDEEKFESAMNLLLQTTDKGHADSSIMIGDMYKDGKGIEEDSAQAEYWYKKAMAMGSVAAKMHMAQIYEEDTGKRKRDYDESRRWYLDAFDNDDAGAALRLGEMYNKGIGTDKNAVKACSWFERAAALGSVKGAYLAGTMHDFGTEGIAHNFEKACILYEQAAAKNHNIALNNLGVIYHNAKGATKDQLRAFQYFKRAADQGYALSKINLAVFYQNGIATTKDLNLALKCLEEAKEGGEKGCDERIEAVKKLILLSQKVLPFG